MLRIDRLYTTVPPHLSCVPENFRRDAKEQGIVLPSTTTDADILEVWDYGSRASWSDDEILGALKAGAVAFGWDGPYCSAVDKDGKVIENW